MPQITRANQDNRDMQANQLMQQNLEQNVDRRHKQRLANHSRKQQLDAVNRSMGKKDINVYVDEYGGEQLTRKGSNDKWTEVDRANAKKKNLSQDAKAEIILDRTYDVDPAVDAATEAVKQTVAPNETDKAVMDTTQHVADKNRNNTRPNIGDANRGEPADFTSLDKLQQKSQSGVPLANAGQATSTNAAGSQYFNNIAQGAKPTTTPTPLAPATQATTASGVSPGTQAVIDNSKDPDAKALSISNMQREGQGGSNNLRQEDKYGYNASADVGGGAADITQRGVIGTLSQNAFYDEQDDWAEMSNIASEQGANNMAQLAGIQARTGPLEQAKANRTARVEQFNNLQSQHGGVNIKDIDVAKANLKKDGSKYTVGETAEHNTGASTHFNQQLALSNNARTDLGNGDKTPKINKVRHEDFQDSQGTVQGAEFDDDGTYMFNSSGNESTLPTDGYSISQQPSIVRSIKQGLGQAEDIGNGYFKVPVTAMGEKTFLKLPKEVLSKDEKGVTEWLKGNAPRTIVNPGGRLHSANKRYNFMGMSKAEVAAAQKTMQQYNRTNRPSGGK